MAITEVEVFECVECGERYEDAQSMKKILFVCMNCDSEFDSTTEAEKCCPGAEPDLEDSEDEDNLSIIEEDDDEEE